MATSNTTMAFEMMIKKIGKREVSCTAGAVAVKNEKGEIYTEKVNVKRYIAGKRPDYAPDRHEEDLSDGEGIERAEEEGSPLRLEPEDGDEVRDHGRRLDVPQVVLVRGEVAEDQEVESVQNINEEILWSRLKEPAWKMDQDSDEDLDENEIERRRERIRLKALSKTQEEEGIMEMAADEMDEDEELETSEEEYTDSEDEAEPRLKPVFVRKTDRITIQEQAQVLENAVDNEKARKLAEERRRVSRKMVEEVLKQELMESQGVQKEEELVLTDDENEEMEYESWKARELQRIKRYNDEREKIRREKEEAERIHQMTEEQRRLEFKLNPKIITNKAQKGKYKFLQKYYHRGAFYLDQEAPVLKRDFSSATLEDHFDKSVLPKVMQVKNFGRASRTKYTHLMDQDTTKFDAPWSMESTHSLKFMNEHGGGMKQVFECPSKKAK